MLVSFISSLTKRISSHSVSQLASKRSSLLLFRLILTFVYFSYFKLYGSKESPGKTCLDIGRCHEKNGEYWVSSNETGTIQVFCYSRCQKYESSLNFCQKFEKSMSPVRIECVFLILNNIITLCHNNV